MLSKRYIADRFLPDKAVDLIDEAASRLRIEIDSVPEEIDEVERRLTQLEIERQALEKEEDTSSQERLAKLLEELSELKEKGDHLKANWQNEKAGIQRVRDLMERIEALKIEEEQAQRAGDLAKASQIRYGELYELEAQLEGGKGGRAIFTHAEGEGRSRGYRRDCFQMDRYTCFPVDGGRSQETAPHGGPTQRTRYRTG